MIQKRSFTRRDFLSTTLKAGTAAFTTGLLPNLNLSAKTAGRYNVLFIMVDDLRPLLGCYGHTEMHTPNIDSLAERGTRFDRAYCQYPLCSPSRTSFITGLRPQTTDVVNNNTHFRETVPDVVTLPQHFRAHGYYTQSVGRVFHLPAHQDDENSWSSPSWRPTWIPFDKQTTPSWEALDVEDDALRDGKTAKRAVQVLEQIKRQQFFLAVGFYKPHLPLKAPRKYFELYDTTDFDLPGSSVSPEDAPTSALTNWSSIRDFQDLPVGNEPLSDAKTLELIRAYAASTSYIDAQIGRVLGQLDALGLTENTVTIFCGDHGHHLGEQGIWGKQTLFEASLSSPLIVSIPGQHPSETDALSELVDIYPTLCDACQLPIPTTLEGFSLMPVIEQPARLWKTGAFSEFNRGGTKGRSIRTTQYRYTEWGNYGSRGQELYDYHSDSNETINIAGHPENAELIKQLSEQLHAGWQAALPEGSEQIPGTQTLPWDINGDGVVDIEDLLLISNSFGASAPENPKVDVNKDGKINIIDLLIVAAHLGETTGAAAPPNATALLPEHADSIEEWLTEARLINANAAVFQRGIVTLERLLNSTIPEKTGLLPNYPNPFNPETWIPYDLAVDADVDIHIYNVQGESIRHLKVGFQTAGVYRTQARAARWDGRNSVGEPVSSGVYFYTLQAGLTRATRRMVIRK